MNMARKLDTEDSAFLIVALESSSAAMVCRLNLMICFIELNAGMF